MTLKILSGVLNTRGHAKEGSATISFAPHRVSGDASGASLVTIGNRVEIGTKGTKISPVLFFP
jgi:hypothetical protein